MSSTDMFSPPVALAGTRRAEEQGIGMLGDPAGGGELEDEGAGHLLVELEVEGVEAFARVADAGLLDPALEEAILAPDQFVLDEPEEHVERRQLVGLGLEQPASSVSAMPEQRSWRKARCSSTRFMGQPPGFPRDDVAVVGERADEAIDYRFPGPYASVRRFVGKLRAPPTPAAHEHRHRARGEAQVDYGEGPMVRDPITGKYRRTRLIMFTLGFSRKSVRWLTFVSSARRWAELNEDTFRRLGVASRAVVLDKALPDRRGVAPAIEREGDDLPVRRAATVLRARPAGGGQTSGR